jgi:hypothetical protein
MSRRNKVNPDRYKTGGRLTPDDLARERQAQQPAIPRERPRPGDDRLSRMNRDDGAPRGPNAEPAAAKVTDDDPADEERKPG